MDAEPSLTYLKIDPNKNSFLDYPDEIRHLIYQWAFHEVKTDVQIHFEDDVVLPCPISGNYDRLYRRMKKNGFSFRDIGENLTVSMLLICKAVHKEAIPRLYNGKAFSLDPDEPFFGKLPKTLMQNIKVLEINAGLLFGSLAGILPYHSEYEPDHDFNKNLDKNAMLSHEYDVSL